MTPLSPEFLKRPLAHRGLHDRAALAEENSLSAFRRAIDHGYGIELDVRPSAEGRAMVFHDADLGRMTGETGILSEVPARELGRIRLGAGGDSIPTLQEVLKLVAGRVPVLVEIKDPDNTLSAAGSAVDEDVARVLRLYEGPVAAMSFNPNTVAEVRRLAPQIAIGLVTCDFPELYWPQVSVARRKQLASLDSVDGVGASFISHARTDLDSPRVMRVKKAGLPVLSWTIRSRQQEIEARKIADNITFEGYLA